MEKSFILTQGDLQIPCRLRHPDHGKVRRVVLGVYGFSGSMDDTIQENLAEEMTLFSSVSLRFDFPAHGESTLGSEFFTVANCVDSLLAVAEYAKTAYPEIEDLCIFASGFGAYITLLGLQDLLDLPGRIRLVVQTPSLRMHNTLLAMIKMSRETFRAMDRCTVVAPRPFDVTYALYEEMSWNIALATYNIPILILHGEQDYAIPFSDIQNFHRLNEGSQLVIIPGTTHKFLEEGAWDMVLDLTRDWFEFEQVLLM